MIHRIDETIEMKDLPTWLQELWEQNPSLARRAEKHYLELTEQCTIHGVMSSALTENEIKIAQIQSAIKKLGYQWQEHQFNGGFDEVYIEIAKDTDVATFDRHKED